MLFWVYFITSISKVDSSVVHWLRFMVRYTSWVSSVVLHQSIKSCRLSIFPSIRTTGIDLWLILRLTWLNSSHLLNLSKRHRNNFAVSHILEQYLRVAYNKRVRYVQIISAQPSLYVCHIRWYHLSADHRLTRPQWVWQLPLTTSVDLPSPIILTLAWL
jgi:hypothetical protein